MEQVKKLNKTEQRKLQRYKDHVFKDVVRMLFVSALALITLLLY